MDGDHNQDAGLGTREGGGGVGPPRKLNTGSTEATDPWCGRLRTGGSRVGDLTLTTGGFGGWALLMLLMFGYSQDEFHDLPTAIGWFGTLL